MTTLPSCAPGNINIVSIHNRLTSYPALPTSAVVADVFTICYASICSHDICLALVLQATNAGRSKASLIPRLQNADMECGRAWYLFHVYVKTRKVVEKV